MINFIKNHLGFKIYNSTWISIIIAMLLIPCTIFLPEKFGYENGILENLQLLILFIGVYLSFFSKIDRKFFIFIGLFLIILILREINCGRTLFFPVPGTENAFYNWKDIKYGYLAHPIFGMYIAFVVIYFLKNKLFLNSWNYIRKTKLPTWNILFMIFSLIVGVYADHAIDNMVFEEIIELLFYTSLVGTIHLYSTGKISS